MQHTFVAYVEDKPGVLTRVSVIVPPVEHQYLLGYRGWVGAPNISRMTLVADAPPAAGHRINGVALQAGECDPGG